MQANILFASSAGQRINSIKIENNKRVETSVIKNYLTFKEKSSYSSDEINNSVKKLYETGLFKEVNVDFNKGILSINVVENPLIVEVLFDGNDKIDDTILASEISLTKRSVYNKNKLNSDVKRILDLYRRGGRFLAKVEPKIIEENNNIIKLVF